MSMKVKRGPQPPVRLALSRGLPLASALIVCVYSIACHGITSIAEVPGPIRLDIALVALAGGAATTLSFRGIFARAAWAPLAACGALIGAAIISPWVTVPWLVLPALLFAWSEKLRGQKRRPLVSSASIVLAATVVNMVAITILSGPGPRFSPEDFSSKTFRANSLMADIPLHDVWVLHLPGGGSATLDDLAEVFSSFSPLQGSPAIFLLGGLREVVGLAFGWEEDRWDDPESSYVSRLGEVDRAASSVEPGTEFGRWRVVYSFPQEAMVETINGTVHASVTCGLEPDRSGSNLYLAFHVREVNWSTRFYMALIDPYRRYFVYPHLLNQFEHTWEREKGGAVTP